ncbi:MAG: RHS repeat-associated core domain-containing protein, partial [Solirubrobacteraceae bacterium]
PAPGPGPAPGDTTPPAGPTLSYRELTSAGTAGDTVWLRRGTAGGFTVTAAAADAESGIRRVSFPALGDGWTGGGDVTAAPYRMRYRFTAGAAVPAQGLRVTATNGASLTSAPAALNVRRDEHLPQTAIACDGGSCDGEPADGPVTVTLNATDAGSGVDRIVYTLDGSAPTRSTGTRYAGPFEVEHATDLRYRAYDRAGNEEALRTSRVAIAPPPDTLNAPPADPSLPSNVGSATEFLYTGPDAVQTGVADGTIQPWRAAALRGRVLNAEGAPVAGVMVRILDRPELGRTVTRADGRFDLAVNGGGSVVLDFEKAGFIDVQRMIEVPWQDYVHVDDVVLLGYDPKVTEIDLDSPEPIQTARGTAKADLDRARQATVMFRQGTNAEMTLPDGSKQELDTLHFRATEYTVGSHGAERMPADLPATSGYTYAVELSADEAVAADATGITFDKPVAFYLENFLDFNVGSAVPVGWYDRERGVWVPEPNGRVIEIVGETGGRADVNLDRDPGADPDRYAEFGLTNAEREELAGLYAPGQSLWRVQLSHFSPIDCNWLSRLGRPGGPGPDNDPASKTTRYYYGDLGNPFLLTASRSASGVLTTYYYDDAGALFALQRGGARFYVGSDQVGTPRVVTNATGTVVKTLTYDSFGVLTEDSDPSFELPIGFAGGLADPTTGLVRFGYRDYDPVAGRWTARDPVFYGGGQANLFAYVSNNPVTMRDPTGLWCIEATGYSGVGGGAKLCHDKDGTSLCLEVGFGLGGSVGLDSGPMELPGSEIEAELKGKCGPIGAGAKCKFDECGLNCKPRGEAGPFKVEPDKVGVKVMTTSGAKAVLEGTKCSLQGKLAGRVCRAWRN